MTTAIKKLVIANCLECPFSCNDTFTEVEKIKEDKTGKFKECLVECQYDFPNTGYTCIVDFAIDNVMRQCPLQNN